MMNGQLIGATPRQAIYVTLSPTPRPHMILFLLQRKTFLIASYTQIHHGLPT